DVAELGAGQARAGRELANDDDATGGGSLRCGIVEALARLAAIKRLQELAAELRRYGIGLILAGRSQWLVHAMQPVADHKPEQQRRQRCGEEQAPAAAGSPPPRGAPPR